MPPLGLIYGREIHVSKFGTDKEGCASINNPCQTIHYAFYNVSSSNHIIKIDGSTSNFTIKHQIRIFKPTNITFTSYNGVALIYRDDGWWKNFKTSKFLIVENYTALEMSVITFKKINFWNAALAKLGHYHALPIKGRKVKLSIINCLFQFSNYVVNGSLNSIPWQEQAIILASMPFTDITIENSDIHANHQIGVIGYPGKKGCIHLSSTKITFKNTRIENARYVVNSWSPTCRNMFTKKGISLNVTGCIVKSKGKSSSRKPQFAIAFGIVSEHTKWMTGRVVNSLFEGFTVTTKMAAVMDIRGPSGLSIINCTFKGNIGYRGGALSFDSATVTIVDSHFVRNEARVSTICANKDEGGIGGAIYVSGHGVPRTLSINRTSFVNNTATCRGSAVYIGYCLAIKVQSTRFSTFVSCKLSSQAVWFSYSTELSIKNVTFEVGSQSRMAGIIFLARYKWTRLKEKTLSFRCPNGSAVNIVNKYARISRKGAIEVKCHHCLKHTYTLRPSYVSGIKDTKSLEVGGQTKCQSCSFGAVCKRGIKPKPNFWGYVYNNKAFMLTCPRGYCCQSKSKCVALQSCNGMRTGRLCGKCKKGYFQSIFTSDCIHEKYCKTGKFWALAVCSCLLFTILVIFLQDIFLIIVKLLSLKKIFGKRKRKFERMCHKISCTKQVSNEAETIRDDNEQDTELTNSEAIDNEDESVDQTSYTHKGGCKFISDNDSVAGGLIKIVFFFYQIHSILTVYKSNEEIHYLTKLKDAVVSVFNLNLQVDVRNEVHCPYHGMDSKIKVLIKAFLPINCIILAAIFLLFMYTLSSCITKSDVIQRCAMKAKAKLLTAILQLSLLGYSTLTSGILSLVTCISLANGQKILYIDGNISCYQHWQYAILWFIVCWALPLIYVIYKLPSYMRNDEITIRGFYIALILPLPSAVYTMVRSAGKVKYVKDDMTESIITPLTCNGSKMSADMTMSMLLDVISGPFRYNEPVEQRRKKLSWEPVLLLQRILLSLCHTFILEPVKRSLVLLLFVMVMANLNIMYRPFNSRFLNATNGVSFILLCITGIMNVIYAFIYENVTIPKGPLLHLMVIFDYVDVTMTLIFPIAIVLMFSAIGIAKLTVFFIATIRSAKDKCTRSKLGEIKNYYYHA